MVCICGHSHCDLGNPRVDSISRRTLADNSVGRVIDNLLRVDLVIFDELGFAPLDPTGGGEVTNAQSGLHRCVTDTHQEMGVGFNKYVRPLMSASLSAG